MVKYSEKIFVVTGKFSNRRVSKMRNFGDDYGETYPFTKYVVETSSKNAIAQVEQEFQDRINHYKTAIGEIKATEKAEARSVSHIECQAIFGIGSFPPNIPRNIDNWEAEELEMPGYRIVLEKIS